MKAPFPYFGGKSTVAHEVWSRFGNPINYVEPFCGSCAVLLTRPGKPRTETVNDLDGYLVNFWRALKNDPENVEKWCDYPVMELDLHARHTWLLNQKETIKRLRSDPDFYDAKIAGWWVWGISCWIGGGWCKDVSARKKPRLDRPGGGVHGRKKKTYLHRGGLGVCANNCVDLYALSDRLRRVRVCCGDWQRVLTPSVTEGGFKTTAVFLDPPYSKEADRDMCIYAEDSGTVAHDVRKWALEHGDNPAFRIALCGYEGEHAMPESWDCLEWETNGGYGNQGDNDNCKRERIWFSPHCLDVATQGVLFENDSRTTGGTNV